MAQQKIGLGYSSHVRPLGVADRYATFFRYFDSEK